MSPPIVRVGQAHKVRCVCGIDFCWYGISWHLTNCQTYKSPEKMAEIEKKEKKIRDRLQEESQQLVDLLSKEATRKANNNARSRKKEVKIM